MLQTYGIGKLTLNRLGTSDNRSLGFSNSDAPTELLVAALNATTIRLTWNDNSSMEDSYSIERSEDGGTYVEIDTVLSNVETYDDANCVSGVVYSYRVRAVNNGLYSEYSNTSATIIINAPSDLSLAIISDTSIQLDWINNDIDADGFSIERTSIAGGGSGWTEVYNITSEKTTKTDNNCVIGTIYYYRVRAYIGSYYSAYCDVESISMVLQQYQVFIDENGLQWRKGIRSGYIILDLALTETAFAGTENIDWKLSDKLYIDNKPPNAYPTNLALTILAYNSIKLDWTNETTDETGFQIERGADGINFSIIDTIAAGLSTYTNNTGLTECTRYYYRVCAIKGSTPSAYSNIANAYTTLIAPSGLTASTVSASEIDLSWTVNSSNREGHSIERSTDNVNFSEIATVSGATNTYQNTSLTEGTTYYYRVRAYKGAQYSSFTSVANDCIVPSAPTGCTAVEDTDVAIDVAWTVVSANRTGHRIYISTDNSTFTEKGTVSGSTATYKAEELTENTRYYFRVVAYTGTRESSYISADTYTYYAMTLTKTTTGASSPTIKFAVGTNCTVKLTDGATWVTQSPSSTSWDLTTGALRSNQIYVNSITTAKLLVPTRLITNLGNYGNSGWSGAATGSASLGFDISKFTELTNIYLIGYNLISGSIANLLSTCTYISIALDTTVTYSVRTWSSAQGLVILIKSGSGWSIETITQALADMAGLTWNAPKLLTLSGNHASMANTNQGGIWGSFNSGNSPSTLATNYKALMKTKTVAVSLTGITAPGGTGDGTGFPAGFGDWYRS